MDFHRECEASVQNYRTIYSVDKLRPVNARLLPALELGHRLLRQLRPIAAFTDDGLPFVLVAHVVVILVAHVDAFVAFGLVLFAVGDRLLLVLGFVFLAPGVLKIKN